MGCILYWETQLTLPGHQRLDQKGQANTFCTCISLSHTRIFTVFPHPHPLTLSSQIYSLMQTNSTMCTRQQCAQIPKRTKSSTNTTQDAASSYTRLGWLRSPSRFAFLVNFLFTSSYSLPSSSRSSSSSSAAAFLTYLLTHTDQRSTLYIVILVFAHLTSGLILSFVALGTSILVLSVTLALHLFVRRVTFTLIGYSRPRSGHWFCLLLYLLFFRRLLDSSFSSFFPFVWFAKQNSAHGCYNCDRKKTKRQMLAHPHWSSQFAFI